MIELVQQKTKKRVPKGTSSYQAAWILEDEEDGIEIDSDQDVDMDDDAEPKPAEDEEEQEEEEEFEEIEMDNRSVKFDDIDDDDNAIQ
jgi:pre-rRNA-processing protein TSR1